LTTGTTPHFATSDEVSPVMEMPVPNDIANNETKMTEVEQQNGDSEYVDQDMTIADATTEDAKTSEVPIKTEVAAQVKLDDLFDYDSDEEFPSSMGQDIKPSSPEAPLSPV
jgi:hypothetical protein